MKEVAYCQVSLAAIISFVHRLARNSSAVGCGYRFVPQCDRKPKRLVLPQARTTGSSQVVGCEGKSLFEAGEGKSVTASQGFELVKKDLSAAIGKNQQPGQQHNEPERCCC
jgi:hypothetical protein